MPGELKQTSSKFQFDLESEYISKSKPLTVRCRNCQTKKDTSLKHLLDNKGVCANCNRSSQADKAERLMRQAGFTPLEPYKGMSLPWKSQCERCGQTSSPLPSNIHKGQGCYWCYQAKLKKR